MRLDKIQLMKKIMNKQEVINRIKGNLIISCQALENEPLHSSFIMARMARAAKQAGACGIRANSVVDIEAIRQEIGDMPIIGIIKIDYDDSDIYITPTMKEVDELVNVGVEIIAMDATDRIRPNNLSLEEFFKEVRRKYPNQLFMADCSTYEEAIFADKIGFDFVGTTMNGYTPYTKGTQLPNYDLISRLVKDVKGYVIAEGGIWSPEQLKRCIDCGVVAAVVGSAITRPLDIAKRFIKAIN